MKKFSKSRFLLQLPFLQSLAPICLTIHLSSNFANCSPASICEIWIVTKRILRAEKPICLDKNTILTNMRFNVFGLVRLEKWKGTIPMKAPISRTAID